MATTSESMRAENTARLQKLGGSFHPIELLQLRVNVVTDWLIEELAQAYDIDDESVLRERLEVLWESTIAGAIDSAESQTSKLQVPGQGQLVLPQ